MSGGQRQQPGPPVTSGPALSSHQLMRLPTRGTVSLPCLAFSPKSSTYRTTGDLSATNKVQAHGGIRLSCRSDTIPARAPLGHPTPYLLGHQSVQVPSNKCNQEESLSMVHLRWFNRDTSGVN